jgi:hypothetical protein
MFGAYIT